MTRKEIDSGSKRRPVRDTSVIKEIKSLKRFLGYAKKRGRWSGDLKTLTPEIKDDYEGKDRWLTTTEYTALLSRLNDGHAFWLVGLVNLGARIGELQKITWHNVDLKNNTIFIDGTKTKYSRRTLPISTELRRWLEPTPKKYQIGRVFPEWSNHRHDLRKHCKALGIESISPNDLRRTFCSWLLQAGVEIFTVSIMMGHGSTKMVEKIYGQLGLGTFKSAMAKFPDCSLLDSPLQRPDKILDLSNTDNVKLFHKS